MPYSLAQIVTAQTGRTRATVRLKVRNAPRRLENELLAILREIVRSPDSATLATAIQRARGWLHSGARWNLSQWERNIMSSLGIDVRGMATVVDGDDGVQAALDWLIALMNDLQVQTAARLQTTAAASAAQGLKAAEAKQELANVVKAQLRRAELIAHDQTQKIAARLNEAQQREAGVDKYIWNHSFLPNARRHHVERQGNVYQWSRPPRDGHPGHAINCRCTAAPLVVV